MLIKFKQSSDVPYSEVTPEHVYRSRREFIKAATAGAFGLTAGSALACAAAPDALEAQAAGALKATLNPKFLAADDKTPEEEITNYNNYYEFGTEKTDPAKYAGRLKVKPWTVAVEGMVAKPGNYGVEDLVNFNALEERVYRHRCVERWSMVMPFIGVPLSDVLNKVQPTPSARYVEFTTVNRPNEMPGMRYPVLEWPYVEGLRIDEAMHPLTLMVVGLYGKVLPNQCGAPLRVHIPWKYGFKSGKSIVKIRLTDKQPRTSWNISAPDEYGFYANVNPNKSHPRWSQANEVRLPGLFMTTKTQLFNGYADQVAGMYRAQNLSVDF